MHLHFGNMFARAALRSTRAQPARQFSTSVTRRSHHDGPYSNLPFAVHNRKIPYGVLHWGFFGLGMLTPVGIVYYYLKKNGNL